MFWNWIATQMYCLPILQWVKIPSYRHARMLSTHSKLNAVLYQEACVLLCLCLCTDFCLAHRSIESRPFHTKRSEMLYFVVYLWVTWNNYFRNKVTLFGITLVAVAIANAVALIMHTTHTHTHLQNKQSPMYNREKLFRTEVNIGRILSPLFWFRDHISRFIMKPLLWPR